jgi:hypothetical protein
MHAYTYTGGARGDGAADGGGREGASDLASCRFAISLYFLQRLYIVNVLDIVKCTRALTFQGSWEGACALTWPLRHFPVAAGAHVGSHPACKSVA